jgi:uncharacterized protein (DUF952 family)
MPHLIYKIATREAWEAAQAAGAYRGSGDDARDGFIHFSTAPQLAGTLAKHFAGQEGLVLVAVDADELGDQLRWEPSRGGELFPHLYGPLPLSAVTGTVDLPSSTQRPDQITEAAQGLREAAQGLLEAAQGLLEAAEESRETPRGLAP